MTLATAAIIAFVWAALLGTAYVARIVMRWRTAASAAAVTGRYLVLAALALLWLGVGTRGPLGAAGMLAPWAAAIAITALVGRRSSSQGTPGSCIGSRKGLYTDPRGEAVSCEPYYRYFTRNRLITHPFFGNKTL